MELTDGGSQEARAIWTQAPVNVQNFTTDFSFQETAANADGFTFAIQNAGPKALGGNGGALGYRGIGSSIAVKFDLFNNSGEGADSTGFYINGANPTVPALDMTASGVNLHSGDLLHAHITYDGTTLTLTLTDTLTGASFTASQAINIPATVGGNTAYVGFTAGTGGLSAIQQLLNWTYTSGATAIVNYPTGFVNSAGLNLQGVTLLSSPLQLTDGGSQEARAVWTQAPVNVQNFTTDFSFQETAANADGFTFAIQNAGPKALGGNGGALGYRGIGSSIAVKFDLFNNSGEGADSTGFYINGANPTVPALDMTASGVNLHSGDLLHAHITYDGTTLTLTLTDTLTGASFTASQAINIPATVGGNTAYVGFTAGTGGLSAIQQLLNWTYTSGATAIVNYPTGFVNSAGLNLQGVTLLSSPLQLTDGGSQEARAVWTQAPVNVQNFTTDFSFQETAANADGFTFAIQNAGPKALGGNGGALGYRGIGSSIAVKFDLFNNSGEGADSTGFYINGANPTVPALDMTASGVNLHSGDLLHAHITYDGTTLTLTLTDTLTGASFTASQAINIPATVGGNTAYVGFTAGTGGLSAIQQLLNWTYVVN